MPAQPLVIPLPKLLSYSDEFLGKVAASYKHLLMLHLPAPETIVIPTATLELMYTSSPMRGKILGLLKNYTVAETIGHKRQTATQLKQQVSALHLNPKIIHTLNHWYHDYLQRAEVEVAASNYPQFIHRRVMGNVNMIESLLEVWAASTHECLVTQAHAHPCLAPTPIVVIRQPKVTLGGVLFTHHPEQLTKASVVCYLWPNAVPAAPNPPAEILELDVRSSTIIRRTSAPSLDKNKPIQINQTQLAALFHAAAILKHQGTNIDSATFVFDHDQILVTELPAQYALPSQLIKAPRTATKVLLAASSTAMIKRASDLGDGIGIVNSPVFLPTSPSQSQPILFQTNQDLEYLLNFPDVLDQQIKILLKNQKQLRTPLGLLPTSIQVPAQWLKLLRILKTKYRLPTTSTPLWFEISTPAVAANLRYFDLSSVGGVVIRVDGLLNLALGNKIVPESKAEYISLANAVMSQTLAEVMLILRTPSSSQVLPLWVQVLSIDPDLISMAVSFGCQAVVCPVSQVTIAREAISQSEKLLWRHRQRT